MEIEGIVFAANASYSRHKILYSFVVHSMWFPQLVMGSSRMASLRESLLQLDLMVEDVESRRTINLELNKDELETMINTLDAIA